MVKSGQQFYCDIFKKTISKGAFIYSMDKFEKALCLEHQKEDKKYLQTNENEINVSRHLGEKFSDEKF